MSDELVTVASFWDSIEAALARNRLESAGVDAWVADEATVGMVWQYANAVGGIKLQVRTADVETARAVLAEAKRPAGDDPSADDGTDADGVPTDPSADVGDERPAADAAEVPDATDGPGPADVSNPIDAAGEVDGRGERVARPEPIVAPPDDADLRPGGRAADDADDNDSADDDVSESPRERAAERAYRAAVLGLLLLPLQFYVFWLVVKVFASDDRLGPRPRRRAVVAGVISTPFVLVALRIAAGLLSELF